MRFPKNVFFRLVDSKTGEKIPNLAVSLILYAAKKNNYYVGPKISDKEGVVIFRKEDCLKEIESSKKVYLMDYTSSLEECLPKISVRIKPKNEIDITVKKLLSLKDIYKKYWDCSEQYLNALTSTNNSVYISKTYDFNETDIFINRTLEIPVEKIKE